MIVYNQALTERVGYMLDQLRVTGFTQWPLVNGAGTNGGEPRMGTHTWPEMKRKTASVPLSGTSPRLTDSYKTSIAGKRPRGPAPAVRLPDAFFFPRRSIFLRHMSHTYPSHA